MISKHGEHTDYLRYFNNFYLVILYERVKNPISGKCRWLTFFVMFCETFCCFKFSKDAGNIVEDFVTPVYIWGSWLAVAIIMISFYLYLRLKKDRVFKYPIEYYKAKDE